MHPKHPFRHPQPPFCIPHLTSQQQPMTPLQHFLILPSAPLNLISPSTTMKTLGSDIPPSTVSPSPLPRTALSKLNPLNGTHRASFLFPLDLYSSRCYVQVLYCNRTRLVFEHIGKHPPVATLAKTASNLTYRIWPQPVRSRSTILSLYDIHSTASPSRYA